MADTSDLSFDHLTAAHAGFLRRLRLVRPNQWTRPTPCSEWNVRGLVNHVVLAELGYLLLLHGGTGQQFLAIQSRDVLGEHPVAAYERSTSDCVAAFRDPGALDRVVDYPLGAVPGRQLLGLRVTETVVHTWDLARATGTDDRLDSRLVRWILPNLGWVYRGVAESPIAVDTEHRFFAAPHGVLPASASLEARLLHQMGRVPPVTHT